jgi:hypothetical protein
MSKEDMKALWGKVFEADQEVEAAKEAHNKAEQVRSAALAEIATNVGKGPFQVAGLGLVTIRSRGKKDGSEPTFFLVGKNVSEVTVID